MTPLKPVVEITLDCNDTERQAHFPAAALGYDEESSGRGVAYLNDPGGTGPLLCLLEFAEQKTTKNRIHFDLVVSGDGTDEEEWRRVTAEVSRLIALGASVRGEHPPRFIGMSAPRQRVRPNSLQRRSIVRVATSCNLANRSGLLSRPYASGGGSAPG